MTEPVKIPDAAHARAFRDALGSFTTGVTLVTTTTPEGPLGFVANSFASVSLEPPLVLWSPARASARFAPFRDAAHYAIHILALEQFDLIDRFRRGGAGFAGLEHAVNPEGVPVLDTALARFECRQSAAHDGGDHLIIVGAVLRFCERDGAPLVFNRGAYGGFAHAG
ncbi:flavin reductase family protein [Gemmobacter serpentinus]|uniref:flavin reductase family protein n=1 Tax=Gemmobacter serpentinus TaxID=2652247 RepID=UPI00124CC92A|nr:flavin reductase family protein [Gemmobacter serpentinus]